MNRQEKSRLTHGTELRNVYAADFRILPVPGCGIHKYATPASGKDSVFL